MSSLRFRPTAKSFARANTLRQQATILAAGREVPPWLAKAAAEERAAVQREALRPPRAAPGSDGRALEHDVQSAIMGYLAANPKVAKAIRFNSGAVQGETAAGKRYFVKFSSEPVVDVYALLRPDGRSMWIEVKRPGWTKPTDERERRQARFLEDVRASGGIGIFATSVDDVIAAIEG